MDFLDRIFQARREVVTGLSMDSLSERRNSVSRREDVDVDFSGKSRKCGELEKRPRLESAPLTSLSDLLDSGMRSLKRRSLVFVVSDFFSAAGWEPRLERIARRHETLAIRLGDPRENELPDIGTVILTDSETGEQLRVNTGDRRFRERFASAARRREDLLNATFTRAGVDALVLRTDEDMVRAIVKFAYARKRRAGRRAAMGASA